MNTAIKPIVFLLATLLLSLPVQADKPKQATIPAQAVGENTTLAVYLDLSQIDAEMMESLGEGFLAGLASVAQTQGDGFTIPLGNPQELVDRVTATRNAFVQAGGEGLMMTVEMPREESWSPPMSLLAKTNGKFDAPGMEAFIRTMGLGEQSTAIESLGNGWQNIAIESQEGDPITLALPTPDKAAFAAINKQLSQHKKPVIALAFRMQDALRTKMDEAEQLAKAAQGAGGQNAQDQMMMGMMMGMFKPIRSLDTFGLAISPADESLVIDAQMIFLNAASAQQFANLYNSIIMFAPALLAGAAQGEVEIENMPDPATINQFFMKLKMNLKGDTLNLTLDQTFFDLAEKMAPLFEGMQGEIDTDPRL